MADPGFKPPAKMSNRERDELLKRGIPIHPPIQPPQQQIILNNNTNDNNATPTTTPEELKPPIQESENEKKYEVEEIIQQERSFLCENCKWCDGFEPSNNGNEKQICRVCNCDLIFHIDVIEEDEDEAEEFSSDDEAWGAREDASYGEDSD